MSIHFLSDLHLRDADGAATKRFCSYLHSEVKPGDTLILGGDVFDLFVGHKKVFSQRFQAVLDELSRLNDERVNIIYLEGNHDFHIQDAFDGKNNITVCRGPYRAKINGINVWVSHGDEIDREDYGYRFLRFITRSMPFQWFLRLTPGAVLAALGNWSSAKSRHYNGIERQNSVALDRTRQLFREYARERASEGAQLVFLGHSHVRDYVRLSGGAEYVNLGFSSDVLLYALYREKSEGLRLLSYPPVN